MHNIILFYWIIMKAQKLVKGNIKKISYINVYVILHRAILV